MQRLVNALIASIFVAYSAAISAEPYQTRPGVAGTITSVGSDTMANLLAIWSDGFKEHYPHVKIQLQSSGSSTAPPALTEGTAVIGPMSRQLKKSEIVYFVREHGYEPTMIKVAMDAITLFVDLDNPVDSLSVQQIDSIFSVTRFCGGNNDITKWNDVWRENNNVKFSEESQGAIQLYGRNAVSGTYGLFKQLALCAGDFKANVKELPSSSSIVQSVAFSRGALGYAAYGFQSAGVKMLAVGNSPAKAVRPTESAIASGEYPFSRYLYLMLNVPPEKKINRVTQEFVRFILSEDGQRITRQEGYVPIPDNLSRQYKEILVANN